MNLPTQLLRNFVAIVDTGSMLAAAEQVYLTQSALSLQVKRLEDLIQQPLFERNGRRLSLTPAGSRMLDHARRLLALNDAAIADMAGEALAGPVRIGMVQDFATHLFANVLGRFAQVHAEAQIYARVAGTAELQEQVERGTLDLAIGFAAAGAPGTLRDAPTQWYGDAAVLDRAILPLVVLERPCRFRDAAIRALDAAGIGHRIAVETPNLSTLLSAVEAGLGVTARTPLFLGRAVVLSKPALPALPDVGCLLLSGQRESAGIERLRSAMIDAIAGLGNP